jgi:hypothetical protein
VLYREDSIWLGISCAVLFSGIIRIIDYVAVDDVGTLINPMLGEVFTSPMSAPASSIVRQADDG